MREWISLALLTLMLPVAVSAEPQTEKAAMRIESVSPRKSEESEQIATVSNLLGVAHFSTQTKDGSAGEAKELATAATFGCDGTLTIGPNSWVEIELPDRTKVKCWQNTVLELNLLNNSVCLTKGMMAVRKTHKVHKQLHFLAEDREVSFDSGTARIRIIKRTPFVEFIQAKNSELRDRWSGEIVPSATESDSNKTAAASPSSAFRILVGAQPAE